MNERLWLQTGFDGLGDRMVDDTRHDANLTLVELEAHNAIVP
jgi:hypothetical protein